VKNPIYLDYAAATPMDPQVVKTMRPYFSEKFYNPSATYLAGRAIHGELNSARATIARWLGVRPAEVYFTAGATEANNLAISGIMRRFPDSEVLVSPIEHLSVLVPATQFTCKKIAVTAEGIINLEDLRKKINGNTVLVSVMLVNNELGTIQPIREVAKIIGSIRQERLKSGSKHPIYLHTDAAQATNYMDLHAARLGVDLLSINGGKIYGPKQTGALYVKAGINILPIILGGGQERNLRSGTENVAGFIGLAKAMDIAQKSREKESNRLNSLLKLLILELKKNVPDIQVNGSDKHQAPHIAHVTFPGTDNERLMMELDENGVQVAVGSACSAAKTEPSHVLAAIGITDELARASLRISLGRQTKAKDITATIKLLKRLLTR